MAQAEIDNLSAAVAALGSAWTALEGHLTANPPAPPLDLTPLVAATTILTAITSAMTAHMPVPDAVPSAPAEPSAQPSG